MDSASWDRRYDSSELVWTAQPNRFLVAETETLAPGRAIDLACGEGRNAVWLAERGWQAVGADFSEVAVDAVAPGGTLLVVAHDSSNLQHGHGGPQDPAVLYTADDVVPDIDGRGLHIERAERVERPVQTTAGERVALDALVRTRRVA